MQYCFSIAKLNLEISGSGQFEILIYYHLEKNHGGSEKGRNQPISCLSAITITLADHYLTKEPVGTKLACSRRSVSKRKHDSKQSSEKRRRRKTSAALSSPAQGFPCSRSGRVRRSTIGLHSHQRACRQGQPLILGPEKLAIISSMGM